MARRPPHSYLTDTERQQLDVLARRAARHMVAADGNRMIGLMQHLLADLQHARATAAGMGPKLDAMRRRAETAEAQLAAVAEGVRS